LIDETLIVDELYIADHLSEPLPLVEIELQLEYAAQEDLVQFLVSVVDAQLLEGVVAHILETEDVQQPNGVQRSVAWLQSVIDLVNKEVE
jgi:hypothetical protein